MILNRAVDDACKAANIQNTPFFLEKVQQLYEMIVVRHGLMIVGLPFGGKTTSYRILAEALGLVEERVKWLPCFVGFVSIVCFREEWMNTGLSTQ